VIPLGDEQETAPGTAIQPAAYQGFASTGQTTPAQDSALAAKLVRELEASAQPWLAQHDPVRLRDMLINSPVHTHRDMVRQYWSTWQACAAYLFAIDELRWMEQLSAPRDESDRAVLDAAHSMIADAVAEKQMLMRAEQRALAAYLINRSGDRLPWPMDLPMTGEYQTRYAEYAARGIRSERLQAISESLPACQDLIVTRAATVHRCRDAILRATRSYSQTGSANATLLQALYLSRENHAAFLSTVMRYNRDIAEYALTVQPVRQTADQVVAMLIPPENTVLPVNGTSSGSSVLREASLPASARPALSGQIPDADWSRLPGHVDASGLAPLQLPTRPTGMDATQAVRQSSAGQLDPGSFSNPNAGGFQPNAQQPALQPALQPAFSPPSQPGSSTFRR
jgi:hypothetical protein